MRLIECVPNFSEGTREDVVVAIRDAIAGVEGALVLDVHMDASHNRSVITFVAPPERVVDAAYLAIKRARDLIDVTAHAGVHPRMGAADVVPLVPLDGVTMEECVALAHVLGARVGAELEIPVFLYERAASRESRCDLAQVRRGGFERLRQDVGTHDDWTPDYGPARIHPTAGAVAIGARPLLLAYNVYVGGAEHLPAARKIARGVRASSGGLPAVKALGLEVNGQAQVSMNLVDLDRTSLLTAFDEVRRKAAEHGLAPTWSEIVGLAPERAFVEVAAHYLGLRSATTARILERRVADALAQQAKHGPLDALLSDVAAPTPAPGGGAAAAAAGALAAALIRMVAGLTAGRPKFAEVDERMHVLAERGAALSHELARLVDRDAAAFSLVMELRRRRPSGNVLDDIHAERIAHALLDAAVVPLETARAAAEVAELAVEAVRSGNPNAAADGVVAALLADAACRAGVLNARVNVRELPEPEIAEPLLEEAALLIARTSWASAEAQREGERLLEVS